MNQEAKKHTRSLKDPGGQLEFSEVEDGMLRSYTVWQWIW